MSQYIIFNNDGSFSFSINSSNPEAFRENVEATNRVVIKCEVEDILYEESDPVFDENDPVYDSGISVGDIKVKGIGMVDGEHKYTLVDGEVIVEDFQQSPPPDPPDLE